MKTSILLTIGIFLFLAISSSAQDTDSSKPPCFEPAAQVFDEFVLTTPLDLKTHAKQFEEKLRENAESQGVIFVYGGKKSKVNELTEMSTNVNKAFSYGGNGNEYKIWIRDGGYRIQPTVVFMLRPLKCTEYPLPTSDLAVDEVEFTDFPSSTTLRVAASDLYANTVHEAYAECPPAAKAVRACVDGTESEVFIIVAPDGSVALSRAVSGHPLVRAAAAALASQWYFKPYKEKGKPLNRSGIIVIRFSSRSEMPVNN